MYCEIMVSGSPASIKVVAVCGKTQIIHPAGYKTIVFLVNFPVSGTVMTLSLSGFTFAVAMLPTNF